MPIKSVKMKISKNKKMRFFLMFQGSSNPKIRFLAQKLWSVARVQRHRHTDTKVTTVGTLSGFQEVFLQPIIKDRPNKEAPKAQIFIICISSMAYCDLFVFKKKSFCVRVKSFT